MTKPPRQEIPITPGVYFFKDAKGEVLYVGKATNLRNRLSSYFQSGNGLMPLKQRLVREAAKVTWEQVDSEIEALLKEAHEIKKLHPPYNVLLRDDKTFISVKVTDEEFPRILPTRKIEAGGTYYGPFTDARAVRETLRILRKLFPYRTSCKPNSGRLCLDAHLGLCPGVCGGRISKADYKDTIRRIKLFFEGKKQRIISGLKKDLREAKRAKDEARALRLAAQIQYLEKVITMAHVLSFGEKAEGDVVELAKVLNLSEPPKRVEGYDISHVYGTLTTASMVVFTDGQANKPEYKKFKIKTVRGANDFASLQEVFRRRFGNHASTGDDPWPVPDLVIVDGGRPQLSAAMEVWRELNLTIPLISLAKRHEEIFTPASPYPIVLPRTSPGLHLVQRVRDEAHRFAVSYHTLLRRKKLLHK